MAIILTDTCVLIDYFSNKPEVSRILAETGLQNLALNSIIVMEILVGARNKNELNSLKRRLNIFQIVEINQPVMDKTEALVERFYLSHGLKIPDAIIAATSIYYDIPLLTFNKKDFIFIPDLILL